MLNNLEYCFFIKKEIVNKLIIFFLLIAANSNGWAQTCFGPNNPTSEANHLVVGSTGGAWTPLTNTLSSNNVYDVITNLSSANQYSDRLFVKGFGFALPVNANVTGITVTIERSVSGGAVLRDSSIMLVKNGVTQTATNKAVAGFWPTTDAIATYGSNTDVWGNTWTGADVNDANFGVDISVYRSIAAGAPQNPRIDHVTVTVCYTGLLPIKLKSFEIDKDNNGLVDINWKTTNEIDVNNIEIERSKDGTNFNVIKTIKATGNGSINENSYYFKDEFCLPGRNYYRLKIIDNNGSYYYSDIKVVNLTGNDNKISILYKNGSAFVRLNNTPGKYYLQVFDRVGKLVAQKIITSLQQYELIELPLALKNNSVYFLKFSGNGLMESAKIFVAK